MVARRRIKKDLTKLLSKRKPPETRKAAARKERKIRFENEDKKARELMGKWTVATPRTQILKILSAKVGRGGEPSSPMIKLRTETGSPARTVKETKKFFEEGRKEQLEVKNYGHLGNLFCEWNGSP